MSLLRRKQSGSKVETFANLTAQDLCDRCPAAGAVVVVMPSKLDLVMCRHHFNKHEVALATQGAAVYVKEGDKR